MQILDLERNKYEVFNSIQDSRKKSGQINAVKYIKELAQITSVDIRTWDLTGVFKSPTQPDYMLEDKRKINAAFFTYKASHIEEDTGLSSDILMRVKSAEKSIGTKRLSTLERKSLNFFMAAERHQTMAENEMIKGAKIRNELLKLRDGGGNVLEPLRRVLSQGFWEIQYITDDSIKLKTVDEITIKYKNVSQEVDITVNMGRFLAVLDLNGTITVDGYSNNIPIHSHDHPHLNSLGNMCLGNMQPAMRDALAALDIFTIFDVCKMVLTSYHDSNPYVALYRFRDERQERENEQEEEQQELRTLEESEEN